MNIVILRHYPRKEGNSMRYFSDELAKGLQTRGHFVYEITAPIFFARFCKSENTFSKWLGYIDQFILFPLSLTLTLGKYPSSTLFVLVDQALGPWLPWLIHRPHVVHVHDLLALQAARGRQPFHKIKLGGRIYQNWIAQGFRKGRYFLSVSKATKNALEDVPLKNLLVSDVVYNPLQSRFKLVPLSHSEQTIKQQIPEFSSKSYLLHVGNSWYKNRLGVLQIWQQVNMLNPISLILVGALDNKCREWLQKNPQLSRNITIINSASDQLLISLYNRAEALVYPSHAEGFGWPVLEALACGCPVVTTNLPPMSEVGGNSTSYIDPFPSNPDYQMKWAKSSAVKVLQVLNRDVKLKAKCRLAGVNWSKKFDKELWIDQIEYHYKNALSLQAKGL